MIILNIAKFLYEKIYVNTSLLRKNKYLIKKGAKIGDRTRLHCTTDSFGSEPYLISVGEDCLFAYGVRFITHDGGIKVLNSLGKFNGHKMDKIEPIFVGNNVYIGMGAYIMPGVHIGDNCIIGAGAIVTQDIPSNSVAVGVPAKVVFDIDTYYNRCLNKNVLYQTTNMSPDEVKRYINTRL